MNVLRCLSREHAIFERLIKRLEAAAERDEDAARREVRNTLLILLSALDKHEKVEDVVFGAPGYASCAGAKGLVDQVESQHRKIQELRLEFLDALPASGDVSLGRLRVLVGIMAEGLRAHFKTEEELLWPHYTSFSLALDAGTRKRLEKSVKALEEDIEANSAAVSEYLESRR